MKNCFDLTVSFKTDLSMPYEWTDKTEVIRTKIERINTREFKSICTYQGTIEARKGTLVISDTKNAVALRLNNDGQIVSRSFLDFKDSLDVCEFAHNLKETNLIFHKTSKKVKYSRTLQVEKEMKDYIKNSINDSKNEDFKKYLYFLYTGNLTGYSKDALLTDVEKAPIDKNLKLYKFIIES